MLVATEIKQVFRMNEGTHETSYAKTSYIQKQVLSLTKPIKEKAIREFYYNKKQPTTTIYIADLGCSSAEENTLNLMYEFINTVTKAHQDHLGNNNNVPCPKEYQLYLNDLPGNDFNTLFKSLRNFDTKLKQNNKDDDFGYCCFVNGVPGSFYERLFPSNHLHLVHSSYSMHWLSQVPEGIEDNKKNVCIASTSPTNVVKAYYEQYQHDFSTFLKCRSDEVVEGGVMVLTMMGRKSTEFIKESYNVFDFTATILNDMVYEGLIEEKKLNNFNFPYYPPSTTEIGLIVEKEGSFTINEAQVSEANWETTLQFEDYSTKSYDHNDFSKCMRAVAEPFLANHFGEAIIDEFFRRFTEISRVSMAQEKCVFVNVTVWLTRKAQSNGLKEII